MKSVPREPTEAMLCHGRAEVGSGKVSNIWRAMYDAAPTAPEGTTRRMAEWNRPLTDDDEMKQATANPLALVAPTEDAELCDHEGDDCHDGICCCCGEPYESRNEGADDAPFLCDLCAQAIVRKQAARIEVLAAQVAELKRDAEGYHLAYRMDCDKISKEALVRAERAERELAALREEIPQPKGAA